MRGGRRLGTAIGLAAIAATAAAPACAQSIEPRSYSAAPVGTNFFILAYANAKGGLSIDPSLPVEDPRIKTSGVIAAYAATFDLFGKTGKIDVIIPYGKLSGEAFFRGEHVERQIVGFGDPLGRVTVILIGAPAMSPAEFATYRQAFLLGVSLQVAAPFGLYDETRLLNLGQNRWSFKPELGMSKSWGPLTVELAGSATLETANNDFLLATRRTQKPIYMVQAHLIYNLPRGTWAAATITYLTGGETSIDGVSKGNLQRNWRAGLSLAVPVTRAMSIKLNASKGVSARTGNNFDLYGVALQYRWISGM